MSTAPIIDSSMTLKEALAGSDAPIDILNSLCLIDVRYWSFDKRIHQGQLVVHRDVSEEVREIFQIIERMHFPVAKVIPIVTYNWSDDASMEDNNTSAFNYRLVLGTRRLSLHAYGKAIDINPRQNPVIYQNGRISPYGSAYNPDAEGTFYRAHPIVREFFARGWQWGGDFVSMKDYHHFYKSP